MGALTPLTAGAQEADETPPVESYRPELSLEAPPSLDPPAVRPAPPTPAETRLETMATERSDIAAAMLSLALAVAAPEPGLLDEALGEALRFTPAESETDLSPAPLRFEPAAETATIVSDDRVPMAEGALRVFGPTRSLTWPGLP